MRLLPEEVAAIKAASRAAFGDDAVVRLFGSRLDDTLRGGDIDLHIEHAGGRPPAAVSAAFRADLADRIGERAVDLVFHAPDAAVRPIDRAAYAGVEL